MQDVIGIGGVFFRAREPEALARWYRDMLGVGGDDGVWRAQGGPVVFAPFPADTDYFGTPGTGWMINFRVADITALAQRLEAAGIAVERRPEWDSEIGRFARIHDPEGNPIELWEPSDLAC
jgi:predicted enzyme related to lactoylglutathione lyase